MPVVAIAQAEAERTGFAPDAFLDPVARELFGKAFDAWEGLGENVERYTARIDQRVAAALRTPWKDREIYRNETAVRAFWQRDRMPVVQLLGARSRYPGRGLFLRETDLGWLEEIPFDGPFAPGSDQLFVGSGEGAGYFIPADEDYLAHPLAQGADTLYRYRSRDTISVSLPDGRRLTAVELDVMPRASDPHRVSGTLWIDPVTGGLVRGAYRVSTRLDMAREFPEEIGRTTEYRLVPGFLKPLTVDVNLVVVDYFLWDFEMWLPHTVRYEGQVAAGAVRIPISIDYAYRIESVTARDGGQVATGPAMRGPEALAGVCLQGGASEVASLARLLSREGDVDYRAVPEEERVAEPRIALRWIAPADPGVLEDSPHLPPPIREDSRGVVPDRDVEAYVEHLARIPAAPVVGNARELHLSWERPDLLRYNRVEGLSVGGRLEWAMHGAYRLVATGFIGVADRKAKVRLDLERTTLLRRLGLGAYHELRATDTGGGHLGVVNSLDALLFGRDNGEYHGAAGAELTWRPPEAARRSFSLRAYAERHEPVETNAGFALFRVRDSDWEFRPNLEAEEGGEAGAEALASPRWGTDSDRPEYGIDVFGRGALWRPAGGGSHGGYGQASVTARAIVPILSSGWRRTRLGVEAAAGHTLGDAPVQRSWFLGGARSLRGYSPSTLSGPSFARGRIELAGTFEGVGGSLFGDAGWAGTADAFDSGDFLYGIGVGASILDGVARIDLSRGLKGPRKGFRIEVYLDAIL